MEFDRHTFYIAASYGMVAIAIIIELVLVRKRRATALQQAALMSTVEMSTVQTSAVQASSGAGNIASEAS